LVLIQQEHHAKVTNPLLRERGRGDELQALHLTEVRWITQHIDEHELGHVTVPKSGVVFLEGRTDGGTFFRNAGTFLGGSFTGSHLPDEFPVGEGGKVTRDRIFAFMGEKRTKR